MNSKIGVIGLGFVGGAMYTSFLNKGVNKDNLSGYDKFKNGGIGSFEQMLKTDILFMALPTVYNVKLCKYDKKPIYETCDILSEKEYSGVIVIKSTVEPETTSNLCKKYSNLSFIHNPEFLTARTAYNDFHNQKHIVLGKGSTCSKEQLLLVRDFYSHYYKDSEISLCNSLESESMKIYLNCFYATKVQFFTEVYLACKANGSDYNVVKNIMLKNGWINKMHTTIPGPDGKISYGGLCFPKDTNALNRYYESLNVPNKLLNAVIEERNMMREDNDNIH